MYKHDSSSWEHITCWWKKTTISKNGKIDYSYHYKIKSSKRSVVLVIDTKISKQLCGYKLIEKDIRNTFEFFNEYKKILLMALLRAIVVTYAKCFVTTTGRGIKLEKKTISQTNQRFHNHLIDMRHEFIAHAGTSEHEACLYVIPIPPKKHFTKGQDIDISAFSELKQSITTSYFLECEPLLVEIHTHVKNKISELNGVINFIGSVHPDQIYKFIRGKSNRILVKEDDLKLLQVSTVKNHGKTEHIKLNT
jgi:hypothetical protein